MDYAYCTDFKRVLALVIGVVSHYVIWFDCFEYTIHQQIEKHFEEIEQFFSYQKAAPELNGRQAICTRLHSQFPGR